jgi:8-amino-7-oxononanoate synthase
MSVSRYMLDKLNEREQQKAYRSLNIISHDLVDFASNDYLGFSKNLEIPIAAEEIVRNFKLRDHGATGSRLISGNNTLYEHVELSLASYHESDAALLFNSGYMANLALLSCVAGRTDTILYDEHVHASIRDGLRLSVARSFSFKHNDIDDLNKKSQNAIGQLFIVTESVFSMNGDEAPLMELTRFSKENNALLIVDEAHALGVKGWGLVAELGIQSDVFARTFTFGKAFGSHGAAVLVNKKTKEFLVNFSRPFIYTTGMPPLQVAYIISAYEYYHRNSICTHTLHKRIQFFREHSSELGFLPSITAIQCLIIPGNERVNSAEKMLMDAGFFVKAIKYPTVPLDQERLRICLHSFNSEEEIIQLLNLLRKWLVRYL